MKKKIKIENKPKNYMYLQTDKNTVDEQLTRLVKLNEVKDDEAISSEDIEESEAAWQDYLSGQYSGESLDIIQQQLLKIKEINS